MPIFESFSKVMAEEVGGKEMKPVKCVDHASSVKLCSLLREKKSFTKFWSQDEEPVEISLLDILEPNSSLPGIASYGHADKGENQHCGQLPSNGGSLKYRYCDEGKPLTFSDTVLKKLKIAVSVDAVAGANASVAASQSHKSTLQYRIVTLLPAKFEELRKRKLLDPEPSYLQQYRRSQKNLYVVTKVVELLNSPVLTDTRSGGVSGGLSLPWNPAAKVKGEGDGQSSRETALTLEKGMVMAYKKKLLVFENDGWSVMEASDDKKKKTFEERVMNYPAEKQKMLQEMRCGAIGHILPIGRLEEPSGQDFKCLEQEVFMNTEEVALLSRNTRGVMSASLQALLGDRRALQHLMDTLDEEKPLDDLTGPAAAILTELRGGLGHPPAAAMGPILYLFEAILVLSDVQHALLAQSMDRRILPHQRELVRSILEPNFKYPWCIPFRLDPQLLAPLQGEGVAITYGLLQECGLSMEPDDPRSTWDLDAKEPLSALFATLTILHRLTAA
ncbi:PREDICTED: gasdermin-C [Condylura cristata]|uniref:gasdermin-C n=1 Tax=Condylura cristata TaxID=143302 RepID=UPI0006430DB7|nr:PREDICTED: gasdermin-C [Condylura cristata]